MTQPANRPVNPSTPLSAPPRLPRLGVVLLALACLVTVASPAVAQGPLEARRASEPFRALIGPQSTLSAPTTSGQACQDGIVHDDGTVEDGLAFVADSLDVVMRFDLPEPNALVRNVCVCWTRSEGLSTLPFDIIFYEVAQDGDPGAFLDAVPAEAQGIPNFPGSQFYTFDLEEFGITIPQDQVYVGVSWSANAFPEMFLCSDLDGGGNQPIFASGDLGDTWQDLADDPDTEDIQAVGVRAEFDVALEPFTCVEDATTLCLTDDRFQVRVDWATNQGTSGVGMAEELTEDTGFFWFFDPANVEMVIKVLDGCVINNNFWVFAGGLTNVEATITVVDSFTGRSRIFTNPLNTPFQPIQNTGAFTCP